jgi:hypothetical protein
MELLMLVEIDEVLRRYIVALNNLSDEAELAADLSYLDGRPAGSVVFDFTHMALELTAETRPEYTPRAFGYQPTRPLLEMVAAVRDLAGMHSPLSHRVHAVIPSQETRVGQFLHRMDLVKVLQDASIAVESTFENSGRAWVDWRGYGG